MGFSPYLTVFSMGGNFPWYLSALYLLAAFILFACSMLLYYKRKLERSQDAFVFNFMTPFISYLIAFFGMTLLGFYFSVFGYGTDSLFYIGLFIGALIFLLIGRMIVKKTFRIFNKSTAVSLGIYLLIAAVFVSSFTFDLSGFEKRIPAESKINGAVLTRLPGFAPLSGFTPMPWWSSSMLYAGTSDPPVLASEENITAIREFHRGIIENRPDGGDFETRKYTYTTVGEITYELNGFFNMYRSYLLNYEYIKNSAELAKIFESEEFKSHYSLANADLSGLTAIEVRNPITDGDLSVTVRGRNNMDELLKYVDMDFKAQTYSEAISFANHYATLSLSYVPSVNQRMSVIGIPKTYTNTINWLNENGYSKQIEITPEMISKILVTKQIMWEWSDSPATEITDKEQIAELLDALENTSYTNTYYQVSIVYYPEYEELLDFYRWSYHYISDETAPELLRVAP